jgi:hypothetical protein
MDADQPTGIDITLQGIATGACGNSGGESQRSIDQSG